MKKLISCIIVVILTFSVCCINSAAGKPKNFEVTYSRTTTSVGLKWNKINDSSYYKVYRKRIKKNSNNKYKLVCDKTTKLSFKDENLKSNRNYKYKVKAYYLGENNKVTSIFDCVIQVNTKKPTDYKNPKKYISYMTKNEKLKLIENDFNDNIKFPNSSNLKEFKITKYNSGTKTYHNYYGYIAKIEINEKYYNKLCTKFEPYSGSKKEQVYYRNVFKNNIKYCTSVYETPRSGRLSKNGWIMTVWTYGATAIIDGKYYLLVDTSFTTANEYFSKNYKDIVF